MDFGRKGRGHASATHCAGRGMDGRGQAAQLEIHVRPGAVRCAAAVMTLALFASVAAAQGRYRVVVGIAGTKQMSLIELVPCIPAEGSGCGAWVSRVIDT